MKRQAVASKSYGVLELMQSTHSAESSNLSVYKYLSVCVCGLSEKT